MGAEPRRDPWWHRRGVAGLQLPPTVCVEQNYTSAKLHAAKAVTAIGHRGPSHVYVMTYDTPLRDTETDLSRNHVAERDGNLKQRRHECKITVPVPKVKLTCAQGVSGWLAFVIAVTGNSLYASRVSALESLCSPRMWLYLKQARSPFGR